MDFRCFQDPSVKPLRILANDSCGCHGTVPSITRPNLGADDVLSPVLPFGYYKHLDRELFLCLCVPISSVSLSAAGGLWVRVGADVTTHIHVALSIRITFGNKATNPCILLEIHWPGKSQCLERSTGAFYRGVLRYRQSASLRLRAFNWLWKSIGCSYTLMIRFSRWWLTASFLMCDDHLPFLLSSSLIPVRISI